MELSFLSFDSFLTFKHSILQIMFKLCDVLLPLPKNHDIGFSMVGTLVVEDYIMYDALDLCIKISITINIKLAK